jgi:hypothetical protein
MQNNTTKPRTRGTCVTCAHWELVVDRAGEGCQDEGLCRRRAPVAVPRPDIMYDGRDADGAQGMFTAWPRTFADSDWCGDWTVISEYGGRHSLNDNGKP